jgi:hypothetical protein
MSRMPMRDIAICVSTASFLRGASDDRRSDRLPRLCFG